MPVIEDPTTPANLLAVDATHKAARVNLRPLEHGVLGHYSWGGLTGIIPAALSANSEIFQFRWSNGSNKCVIRRIRISTAVSTTFFAAGVPHQIDLIKSSAWSVAGTGGTAPAFGDNNKRISTMGNSLISTNDVRIASNAALGAGTKTLETNSLAAILIGGPITASLNGTMFQSAPLWDCDISSGDFPLVLGANEGISIRSVAVPATGTWTAAITVDWTEVASYP